MKRFIVSVLCVSVFFIGLGGLVSSVGAKLKSDEKALELLRLARQAVGGEANIKSVLAMSITGRATKTFDFDGAERSEQGDWELNLQLPNKFSRMMKVRVEDKGDGVKMENKDNKVVIIRKGEGDKVVLNSTEELPKEGVVIIKKGDGDKVFERTEVPNGDVKKVVVEDNLRAEVDKMQHNDLVRTTLSLLLTAPQDVNIDYAYVGEGSVDGSSCNIVEARTGDSSVKLYLDKSSNLPRMMSYQDAKPMMFFRIKKDDADTKEEANQTFTRKIEAPEMAEYQIKFSDYRSVNGLQLPFKWTQTVGGKADETIEVSSYEINPANIADKFNELPQKIMFRTKKEQ